MNYLAKIIPTKTKILLFVLTALILILGGFLLFKKSSETTFKKASPLLKSEIGKTTGDEIEKSLKITKKESSTGGTIRYSFQSNNPLRPDQIELQDGVVKFERVYIPEDPSDPGYLKISDMESKFGKAELIKPGSKFWGSMAKTYIYAKKGFVFIGNPYTNEVFEIQQFKPMSTEEYLTQFGEDVTSGEIPKEKL